MENESSALAVIDAHTGEVVPSESKTAPATDAWYIGAAAEPFSSDIQNILTNRIPETDLDILPTGEVYASQVRYRRILNDAFGVGGWALIPRDALRLDAKDNYMYRTWALYAHGRYIAEATGEQEYQESNKRMSYASAAEGVKSNALTRCCKDLGIASECWDRRFTEDFKKAHCVQVWCDVNGKMKTQWRRKDAEPFWNEKAFVIKDAPPTHRADNNGSSQEPVSLSEAQKKMVLAKAADTLGIDEAGLIKFAEVQSIDEIRPDAIVNLLSKIVEAGKRPIEPEESFELRQEIEKHNTTEAKVLEFFGGVSEVAQLTFAQFNRALRVIRGRGLGAPQVAEPKPSQQAAFSIPSQSAKLRGSDLVISEPQRKRLYAIAKGNRDLIKEVIGRHGYEHDTEITRPDYEAICAEVEKDR